MDEFVRLVIERFFDINTKMAIYVLYSCNIMLIFGWIGGIINAFHILPQVIKNYRRKSTQDISLFSIIIKITASVTYCIHGVVIGDPPLFYMTALVTAQYMFILLQYKYYSQNKKCDVNTVVSDSPTIQAQNMQNDPHV